MQINISTRHGQIGDSARDKVESKVGKLARFFDRVAHIDVTLDMKDEGSPEAEVLLRTENKHDFVAKERAGSLIAAVEASVHKVEQQIKKYKTKLQDHRGPGTGQASVAAQEALADEVDAAPEPSGEES
ncbi:MAG: ribosome-associated translation inhibitor RaiA [Pirellulales bacterium]|nr:ribosome-associated translation inhibitor RaiA [Pirellulales bacterium]